MNYLRSLTKYLVDNFSQDNIDFSIRIYRDSDVLRFYIHPTGKDGDTVDYIIGSEMVDPRDPSLVSLTPVYDSGSNAIRLDGNTQTSLNQYCTFHDETFNSEEGCIKCRANIRN